MYAAPHAHTARTPSGRVLRGTNRGRRCPTSPRRRLDRPNQMSSREGRKDPARRDRTRGCLELSFDARAFDRHRERLAVFRHSEGSLSQGLAVDFGLDRLWIGATRVPGNQLSESIGMMVRCATFEYDDHVALNAVGVKYLVECRRAALSCRRSAELLGESDEKPFRPPDVAEPIRIFILDNFAH